MSTALLFALSFFVVFYFKKKDAQKHLDAFLFFQTN